MSIRRRPTTWERDQGLLRRDEAKVPGTQDCRDAGRVRHRHDPDLRLSLQSDDGIRGQSGSGLRRAHGQSLATDGSASLTTAPSIASQPTTALSADPIVTLQAESQIRVVSMPYAASVAAVLCPWNFGLVSSQ